MILKKNMVKKEKIAWRMLLFCYYEFTKSSPFFHFCTLACQWQKCLYPNAQVLQSLLQKPTHDPLKHYLDCMTVPWYIIWNLIHIHRHFNCLNLQFSSSEISGSGESSEELKHPLFMQGDAPVLSFLICSGSQQW